MWSAPVTVGDTPPEPVTLAQAKQFVALDPDVDEFDELLGGFIAAAREQAEDQTGMLLTRRTVDLFADDWNDLAKLPVGPIGDIVELEYAAGSGGATLVAASDYQLTSHGYLSSLYTVGGFVWPQYAAAARRPIRLRVEAGFDEVPPKLRTAVLIMTADQFAFRESVSIGSVSSIPTSLQVDAIFAKYRDWI